MSSNEKTVRVKRLRIEADELVILPKRIIIKKKPTKREEEELEREAEALGYA